MNLLIVETPAKAKTISKYVGDEYEVRASVGHVRDLPKNNKKAIDIPAGFVPHYEISRGKEHVVEELRELSESAQQIFLATDPDREGEAIAWHLFEALDLDPKKTKRVAFHEITKDEWADLVKKKMTWEEVAKEYPQPEWCKYPGAVRDMFGCWSLTDTDIRLKISRKYCKTCEMYIPLKRVQKVKDVV